MTSLREQVRSDLRIYMSRTGLSLTDIAMRSGYSRQTVAQFVSAARFGNSEAGGDQTAENLRNFIRDNPAATPELPGKLYETEATAEMDRLIAHGARGRMGTGYGPAGSQKTFTLECRAAQAAVDPEPRLIYIRASADGMSPAVLLRRIAAGLSAPYAQYVDGLRRSILFALGKRRTPVALALDEAQHLYRWIETLETLREIGDLGRGRIGIIVIGNEQVMEIFKPRRGMFFEQWRSRIDQKRVRVLGPSREEAREIIAGELGETREAKALQLLDDCMVTDPISKRRYVNVRRLFDSLRDIQDARGRKLN